MEAAAFAGPARSGDAAVKDLQDDGAAAIVAPWNALLGAIAAKSAAMRAA